MAKYLSEQDALKQRVARWAIKLRVNPRLVRVQRMTRKWGSCSSAGTITLATDLLDEPDSFQDFVVAHELLHLRVPNHGRLFKALMTAYVPGWRTLEVSRSNKAAL
jgi:predicted metal-dependent hydrolase